MMLGRISSLLAQDVLTNISLLKLIAAHGAELQIRFVERDMGWAVILLLPTSRSAYDTEQYPETDGVVYMSGSGSWELLAEAIAQIPAGRKYVFKVPGTAYAAGLQTMFQLQHKRAFYSFTSQANTVYPYDAAAVEGFTIDERLVPIWHSNGYPLSEIQSFFNQGARSYTLWQSAEPVSTCLVFPNYSHVWEVGAVHTVADRRGRGYARRVVQSAISRLLADGLVPRYQVANDNWASIKLAESIGLRKFVVLQHLM